MKKYAFKYLIFLMPFLAAIAIELFFLPVDFFTFRAWEALVKQYSVGVLKGPFYPNMTLIKTEEGGDLKPSQACTLRKQNVLWQTDAYGYRKAPSASAHYPIIIVGDSNAAGGGLSQSEMLSEVLQTRLNKAVYPLAPESIKYIFKHPLLKQSQPEVVILESIERGIPAANYAIRDGSDFRALAVWEKALWSVLLHPAVQSAAVHIDRILKANMLQFARARINSSPPPANQTTGNVACPMLFFQGARANQDIPDPVRQQALRNIRHLSDFFTAKGIRFIFLPVPNKENIHYRELGAPRPVFLEKLIAELKEAGVEVADTQKTFEEITGRSGASLYHRDDTHWNADGVKVAASLIEDILRSKPPTSNSRQALR